jgi:hypothetical protein
MVEAHEKSREFSSLEDFVDFGKQGGKVHVTVGLSKDFTPHNVPAELGRWG